ncbi:hypothetical protein DSO57_1027267 [Entomophthora muscae]|uniref:Uncharacterized protein n=1 Tax=Entomophthora muscae TaxID=34485 RepID=A0ACC2U0C1_9FUNG|nr:hypothetical protein DSO57_1027267 [Entomophthora muscae]
MGTPDLEQVMVIALGIAHNGVITCLQLQFNQAEYYKLIVALQFPQHLLTAAGFTKYILSSFVQAALAHIRNIPENNLSHEKIVCTMDIKSESKKLKQSPLIRKTVTQQQFLFGFYTLAASQPVGGSPPFMAGL